VTQIRHIAYGDELASLGLELVEVRRDGT